ncbi:MAG: hypothetical protein LBB13_00720 [Rickettsiales bacterium]|jgi:adenylate kinase family enzyme|nr:hypothetical protein [Rickettsiales bacterium]
MKIEKFRIFAIAVLFVSIGCLCISFETCASSKLKKSEEKYKADKNYKIANLVIASEKTVRENILNYIIGVCEKNKSLKIEIIISTLEEIIKDMKDLHKKQIRKNIRELEEQEEQIQKYYRKNTKNKKSKDPIAR